MLSVRKAGKADLEAIMSIYTRAQDFMIRSGNPSQWGHFYPTRELIQSDIKEGACMAICDGDDIHGVFALFEGDEPTYERIEGAWLNDGPYVTIHRIAGDGLAHGVFRCAADHCKRLYANIRIDTHADNRVMQRQIEKNGFERCGIIHVADGSPRIAYQWTASGAPLHPTTGSP